MVKEKLISIKDKAIATTMGVGAMVVSAVSKASCDLSGSIPTVNLPGSDVDPDTIFSKVLGVIMLVARYVGIGLLIWGLVMFAFSVKNDDAESKQKAISTMVAGVVAIAINAIYSIIVPGA